MMFVLIFTDILFAWFIFSLLFMLSYILYLIIDDFKDWLRIKIIQLNYKRLFKKSKKGVK